jgi:hypothetical protein
VSYFHNNFNGIAAIVCLFVESERERLREGGCVDGGNILDFKFCRVLNIVCILLRISPASNFGKPTFWNPVSVPSSRARSSP